MIPVSRKLRVIAFYLPQYHPIPENDEWWGPGFTEWRNVAKARPLYRGHYQPHLPADLGFYDLRLPEVREAQAEMARTYGVEGFCYWHYWFAGRRILERPFNEVLLTRSPSFPFCLGWANQSWTGIWHGLSDKVLIAQTYPGPADYRAHFEALLPAFSDPRYLTVDGKPLFYVYGPMELPDAGQFVDIWQDLAFKAGFRGLYIVGEASEWWDPGKSGFDAIVEKGLLPLQAQQPWSHPVKRLRWEWKTRAGLPTIYQYSDVWRALIEHRSVSSVRRHPRLLPNWDNTPRSGKNGLVLQNSTPELFGRQVRAVVNVTAGEPPEHRIAFLKSWNEWAEGNYVEPDLRFGRGYLEVLRAAVGN
jgi:lipopolysaccharide biosynthesis protein